jgi:hypothetical protein
MKLVAQNTTINIPKIHRSFTVEGMYGPYGSIGYIVMDYVPGTCLADFWDRLSHDRHINIAERVVDIIQQLQSLRCIAPGPIGGGVTQGH